MASKKKDKQSPNQGKSSGAGTDIPMSEKTERWVSALFIPVAVIGLLVYNAMQDSSGSLTIYPQTFITGTTPGDNGSNGAPENHSEPSEITVIAEGIVLNDLKRVSDSSVFATLIGNA